MAIGTIANGEAGNDVRAKMNAAIGKANLVDELAGNVDALQTSKASLARVEDAETDIAALQAGKATNARVDDVEAVRATYAEIAAFGPRPGEIGDYFTATLDGAPDVVAPRSGKAASNMGKVATITGAGIVAPRAGYRVEPGHPYRARVVVRRATDTSDPANDGIRIGLRCLKFDYSGMGTIVLEDLVDIGVSDGRIEKTYSFPTDVQLLPAGTVYVRPFVETYGGDGVTHVEVVELTDMFSAVSFSPDVEVFQAQVAGFAQSLDGINSNIVSAQADIVNLQANQVTGRLVYQTWADLDAVVGTVGQGAEVATDDGGHVDPVTGDPIADDRAFYIWSASPAGWTWISEAAYVALGYRTTALEAVTEYIADLEDVVATDGGIITSADEILASLFEDPAGYAAGAVLAGGIVAFEKMRIGKIGEIVISYEETNYDLVIQDMDGNAYWGIMDGGIVSADNPTGAASALDGLDAANKIFARNYLERPMAPLQQPVMDINTIDNDGQSLGSAAEAWPALSGSQQFGNLMLGSDVRPTTIDGTSWTQVSPTGFQPLVAKVRDITTAAILTGGQVAALSPGDQALGEICGIGMANMASWLISRRIMGAPKPFAVVCPAVGGKTIEQLSKVNSQDGVNRYGRFTGAITQAQSAAVALSKSHAVTAIVWLQGEWDYTDDYGSTKATKALYKAALAQMHADKTADIKAATGQTEDPLLILYQTGGAFTRDVDMNGLPGLHVGMAQLEYALENPDTVVMAGPIYPVTDKGGHLDANGSRWYGQMLAKAYFRAVIEGKRFRPLSPIKVEMVTLKKLWVHFFVPAPPIRFDLPYVIDTATDYATKGFRVTDESGAVTISSVSIVTDTIVEITLAREIDLTSCRVWYASQTGVNGNGCLCDSDNTVARDLYTYLAGSGMYASADIPALVDNPYPLNNWCTAFYLPVGYEE